MVSHPRSRLIRRHPLLLASAAALLVVAAVLELTYFQFHKHFIDKKVSEAAPTFLATEPAANSPTSTAGSAVSTSPTSSAGSPVVTSPAPTTRPANEVRTAATGEFVSRAHTTTGTALVLTNGIQSVLRFENLRTDNGPDVRVYLSAGVDAQASEGSLDDDFVELGKIKGNIGDQNYEIPDGTDLGRYRTVVLWCKRFSVAFGAADLTLA